MPFCEVNLPVIPPQRASNVERVACYDVIIPYHHICRRHADFIVDTFVTLEQFSDRCSEIRRAGPNNTLDEVQIPLSIWKKKGLLRSCARNCLPDNTYQINNVIATPKNSKYNYGIMVTIILEFLSSVLTIMPGYVVKISWRVGSLNWI